MNNIRKLLLGIATLAIMSSAPALAQDAVNRASDVGRIVQSWQPRLVAAGMTADDARSWTVRSMGRFARLNDERLALAERASSLSELEVVLMDSPLGAGSPLATVMANPPGSLAMMGSHYTAKSSPATSPSAYAGMVFTALNPCRILDTRPSQGGAGAWMAGSSNVIKIGPYSTAGGGYQSGPGAQGGSATSCGLDTLSGPGQVAVIMAAVSTVSQVGAGYLTFYPQGSPNPGLTSVSQWYQPGYVQTSFVLIPTDLVGTVTALGFTSATSDVIIDVVGYFAPEPSEAAVTSITAGTGLTGGTITSTGTIGLAATQLMPAVACATNQIPKWSGTAWICAADANSGGLVTAVSASSPLASSGGTAPNISLNGVVPVANGGTGQATLASNGVVYGQGTGAAATAVGTAGQLLAGTAGAPTWTGSPSISGNLTLANPSTATTGSIMKGASSFIHNVGADNTFLGVSAGNLAMTGASNTGVGSVALTFVTAGSDNTAIGFSALAVDTAGTANTAAGSRALLLNTTGMNNTAVGASALLGNSSGSDNTAVGFSTLSASSGDNNTAVGAHALAQNDNGSGNVATGWSSLNASTTGNLNTATGQLAMESNTSGSQNTAIGAFALDANSTGSSNIGVGTNAGANLTTGNFNIDIGNAGVAAEGNTIRIGDGNQTRTFISGIRGVPTGWDPLESTCRHASLSIL